MKKILIPVGVAVAVALIAPKIVSSQFASGLQNSIDAVNKNPAYAASVTSIESGWFSSQAEVNVAIVVPEMAELSGEGIDMSADIVINAQHGPILTQSGFSLGWLDTKLETKNGELPAGLVVADDQAIYQFNGVTGLFMSTSYQDSVAAMEYTDPDNQTVISFSGLNGEGEFSGSKVVYSAISESMTMSIPEVGNADIKTFEIKLDADASLSAMMQQGLYDSESVMSIKSIMWNDLVSDTQTSIDDTKLLASSNFDEASGLGGGIVSTTIASMNLPIDGETLITDTSMVIELKNLQAKFLLAYQDLMNDLGSNPDDIEQISEKMNAFMQEYALEQLQANPEYNITDLSGKINGSAFDGKALAKLEGVTELPLTLEDPGFWMQHSNVDSTLSVEKGAAEFIATQVLKAQLGANPQFAAMPAEQQAQILAQQVAPTLEGMVQQGMLTMNGEKYEISFALVAGAASLNGNPIPL